MYEFAFAVLIVALAGLVRGYGGFGGGLVTIPLLTLIYGPVESYAMAAIIAVIGYVQLAPRAVKVADWSELTPALVAITIATPIGVAFLVVADPALIRRLIGVFVLLGAALLATGWVYRGHRGVLSGGVAGALCGGISGVAGVGGPPLVIYFLSSPVSAEIQRASILIATGCTSVLMVVALAIGVGIDLDVLGRAAILFPVSMIGTWLGARGFAVAPHAIYRRVATGLLFLIGVAVIVL